MGANNAQSKIEDKEVLTAFRRGPPKGEETTAMAYCRHDVYIYKYLFFEEGSCYKAGLELRRT
jgi:hypothetical protein